MASKEEIKVLSKEEIIQRLKDMVVDNENVYSWKWFSFIVMNPDYNPSEFSQEIEDSEEMIDEWAEVNKEMKKPEFDIVWHNTLSTLPRNSDKWLDNHSKICPVKTLYFNFLAQSITHENNVRNYYSDSILDKVMAVSEKYGGIVSFV